MWVIAERKNYLLQFTNSPGLCFLTDGLIACCRQFICRAPREGASALVNRCSDNYTIREESERGQVYGDRLGGGFGFPPMLQFGFGFQQVLKLCSSSLVFVCVWKERNLPNTFGFTSSLVKELSPSSSSETSTSSSCKPFFGSQVILFSFFNRLLALANQQLT